MRNYILDISNYKKPIFSQKRKSLFLPQFAEYYINFMFANIKACSFSMFPVSFRLQKGRILALSSEPIKTICRTLSFFLALREFCNS